MNYGNATMEIPSALVTSTKIPIATDLTTTTFTMIRTSLITATIVIIMITTIILILSHIQEYIHWGVDQL